MASEKREKLGVGTEVSVAELAVLLGLSADRVYQLIRGGTFQTVRRGRLMLADSLQRYVHSIKKVSVSDEDVALEWEKRGAEVTLKTARAKIAKLEADELEGKMHRSEDVAAMTEDLIYTVRGSLMALPGRLAVDVAETATPAEAAEIIRKETHAIMRELAQYRYDPKKYEERVRARMNWDTCVGDGDDE